MSERRAFLKALAGAAALSGTGRPLANEPAKQTTSDRMNTCCPVVELRQYTIRGGRQADFKRLFATTFVTPQTSVGIHLLGWFDDLDDPDRFVWMRGFSSMEARAPALTSFYGSDVWKAHRDQANEMIVDSDNVLLLQPTAIDGGIALSGRKLDGFLTANVHYLPTRDSTAFDRFFSERMLPRIQANGGAVVGRLCTHDGPNNFPRLPVRANECVYAWFTRFDSETAQAAFAGKMCEESGWRDGASDPLLAMVMRRPEVLRLRA